MTSTQKRNLLIATFILSDIIFFVVVGVFVYYNFFRDDGDRNCVLTQVGPENHCLWAYASSKARLAVVIPDGTDFSSKTDYDSGIFTLTILKDGKNVLTVNPGQDGFENDHVFFISANASPVILREVSFDEIGIEPVPRAMKKDGWTGDFIDRIKQKLEVYLEKHAAEIFGETTSEHEA